MLDLTFKRWLSALCWSALLIPAAANAAGLGRLTILSGLGQPLNAEIELVSPQKGETLTARLGSIDLYQQANLPYNPALVGARVTVERRADGRPYVKVTTPLRVSEPFAELLIELNSENGRVTRQYTVLLDPPGYGRAASEIPPPAVAPPAVRPQSPAQEARSPATAPSPTPSEPIARAPAAPAARAPVSKSAPSSPAESSSASTPLKQYGPVKRGETLGRIARTVQPEGVTLEQTLVGLFRQNPDAFLKKNMNLVKSGRILKVPEPGELAGLPQREAVTEVRLQTADFESFRGRLADRAGSATEAGSVTSGRIGARVAGREKAEPRDTLRVSRAESSNQASTKGSPDRLRALEEEMVAREKALADANDRIAQLEKTIQDMQRLAQMKSAGAIPQPGTGSGAGPQPSGGMGSVPSSAVVAPAAPASAVPSAPGALAVLPTPPAIDAGGKPVEGTKPGDASQPVDVAQQAAPAKPAAPAKAPPPAAPQPAPAVDMVDLILNEPMYLAAGGAVLVAGLALVAVRRRRSDPDRTVKIAPTLGSGTRPNVKPEPISPLRSDEATSRAVSTNARYAPPASPTPASPLVSAPPANPPAVTPPRPATAEAPKFNAAPPKAVAVAPATVAMQTPAPAALQPPVPLAEVPAASDAGDDNDLDFNAGSPYAAPAVAPAGTTTGLAATAPLTPPRPALTSPPATPVESAEAASARKLKTLQDTFEKSLAQARGAESPPREISFADFSLDDSKSDSQAKPAAAGESASSGLTFEPLPAIDLPPPDVKPSVDAPDLDFKLADLNLDGAAHPAGVPKDEHWYDVQQKFDLAKAYQEMGDKQGARDILGEVLKEGDSAQQAQAQKVLSSLG